MVKPATKIVLCVILLIFASIFVSGLYKSLTENIILVGCIGNVEVRSTTISHNVITASGVNGSVFDFSDKGVQNINVQECGFAVSKSNEIIFNFVGSIVSISLEAVFLVLFFSKKKK